MKTLPVYAVVLLACLLGIHPAGYAQQSPLATAPSKTWNFQVYLDENPIGSHSFAQYGEGRNYQMRIQADFEVKFLLFFSYTYEHRNQEHWRGGCLQAIASETDDNGELYTVTGARKADAFSVVANQQARELPACISTFAYWDTRFLKSTTLLNSQNGEYLPVEISGPFPDQRPIPGKVVEAQRYRIQADEIDIRLWYSPTGDWLSLESVLKNGRTLRYERL